MLAYICGCECFRVVIRGGEEDYAVLCTADRTYDIKEADISNSLLLVPGCVTGRDMSGACDTSDIRPLQVKNHCNKSTLEPKQGFF